MNNTTARVREMPMELQMHVYSFIDDYRRVMSKHLAVMKNALGISRMRFDREVRRMHRDHDVTVKTMGRHSVVLGFSGETYAVMPGYGYPFEPPRVYYRGHPLPLLDWTACACIATALRSYDAYLREGTLLKPPYPRTE
jgi:hypothetical protein